MIWLFQYAMDAMNWILVPLTYSLCVY